MARLTDEVEIIDRGTMFALDLIAISLLIGRSRTLSGERTKKKDVDSI
jgi:hypothetical protein